MKRFIAVAAAVLVLTTGACSSDQEQADKLACSEIGDQIREVNAAIQRENESDTAAAANELAKQAQKQPGEGADVKRVIGRLKDAAIDLNLALTGKGGSIGETANAFLAEVTTGWVSTCKPLVDA